jgi:NAD(P)-dependent dehydrogenase (short-subunit alcohol dehydrogenase family)
VEIVGTSALVTGGASGLGAATAKVLVDNGAAVVIVDANPDLGKATAAQLGAEFVEADVTDAAAVSAAVECAAQLAPLRVLVNCAGIGRPERTVSRRGEPASLDIFERVIRTNLIGTFNCIRLAAAKMASTSPTPAGERGSILNTSSMAAFEGQIGQASYSASKAAIAGMTLPIARDLAAVGIRVNTIAPGLFDTPIWGGPEADPFKSHLVESVMFPRRLGHPHEFARLALELLTNDYMNGEVVRLDGATRLPPR